MKGMTRKLIMVLAAIICSVSVVAALPPSQTFGFNHRVGASSAPYIVIHGPTGEALPTGEDGTTVTYSSDGSAFIDVAVIGMRYEEAFSLEKLKLTFSSFANASGSTCPYVIRLRDPHGDKPVLCSDVTSAGLVTVWANGYDFKQYLTSESFYTDDLVFLSMKADTTHLAAEAGKTTSTYTLTVIIEAVYP